MAKSLRMLEDRLSKGVTKRTSVRRDDNLDWRGNPDRLRVNIQEPWELSYWSKRFGITRQHLIDIVERVGPIVKKVEAALSRRSAPKLRKAKTSSRKPIKRGRPRKVAKRGRPRKTTTRVVSRPAFFATPVRRVAKKKAKKRRTAAQKAATARMLAARQAQLRLKERAGKGRMMDFVGRDPSPRGRRKARRSFSKAPSRRGKKYRAIMRDLGY